MWSSPATWTLLALGLSSVVLVVLTLRKPESTHSLWLLRRFSRPASAFVQHMMDGAKKPAGVSMKDFMYQCFQKDVARGMATENPAIPPHSGFVGSSRAALASQQRLRLVSFNVHFFRSGFSAVELAVTFDDVLSIVAELSADLLLLQEVPKSAVPQIEKRLASAGFPHCVAAGSADAHVLPAEQSYPGERLHVVLASRLPLLRHAVVPMLDGHAAFAEVDLGAATSSAKEPKSALLYTLHLSVRCEASKRRDEVDAVLRHAASLTNTSTAAGETAPASDSAPILIAGDFNQPNEIDYPAEEW